MKQFAFFPPAAVAVVLGLAGCGGDLTLPASPPAGLRVDVLQGDGQTGTVGDTLPNPVVVQVRTEAGAAMAGQTVVFVDASGGATAFDPDTTVTNERGQAVTRWVLGTAPGTYNAEARLVSTGDIPVSPAELQASAVAGVPDTVRADSPTIQGGHRGEQVVAPPVVVVVDRFGNPVPGAEVKWKVENGNGEVSPDEDALTDADGRSTVTWTLGNRVGVQQLKAEVGEIFGSPVTFTATILF